MSGTDVQIDPTIVGGVNLSLKDKPLRYVFNRICGLSDVRYEEKYGIVVFQRDIPYAKTYNLDFLDVTRDTSSSMTINTSGLSSNTASGGNSTVTTKSSDNFLDDIVKDIKQIIQTTENTNKIYTQTAEKIQRLAKTEEEEKKLQEDINNGVYNKDLDSSIKRNKSDTYLSNSNISSKMSDEIIRLNRRAGLITVTASTKSHRKIENYLKKLRKKYSSQVLIEMRFLEVKLKKEYEAGIDWTNVFSTISKLRDNISSGGISHLKSIITGVDNPYELNDLTSMGKIFEQFGSTRTLSNPRINAINNQPALMTFATNHVYFKTKSTYQPPVTNATSGAVITPAYRNVESESLTMPLGIIMSVLPSIDTEKGEIVLSIKPTISKLAGSVKDPATSIALTSDGQEAANENLNNEIPIASVRELDTILKLKDGQTAIIGGFTERGAEITDGGAPLLRSLPLLGNLFTKKNDKTEATETIILVKATIVNNGKQMSDYDKDIYTSFSDDPRMNEI